MEDFLEEATCRHGRDRKRRGVWECSRRVQNLRSRQNLNDKKKSYGRRRSNRAQLGHPGSRCQVRIDAMRSGGPDGSGEVN